MNKLLIFLVAVVSYCEHVHGHNGKKCMGMFGKMDFDHEKFSGEWFVVAKGLSATIPRIPATCNKLVYSAKEDGNSTHVGIHFTLKSEDKSTVVISKGQPIWEKMGSVTQAVWKREGDDKWMAVFTQTILATDYDQFAVMYACHPVYNEEADMFDKFELVQVLSRKTDMDSTLLNVLKNVLTGFDFHVDDILMADNTGC